MAGSKRAREVARAKHERQAAKRAEAAAARRRRNFIILGVVGAILVIGGLAYFVISNNSNNEASPSPSASASKPPTPVATPSGVSCTQATPQGSTTTFRTPPDQKLPPNSTLTLATNCGDITIAMDVKKAPKTTNAIGFLAKQGYYTDKSCHRLVVEGIYVLQCGAMQPDGQGNPGFSIKDENLPAAGADNYPEGVVAMANSGPNTSNTQIFLVYKNSTLPPNYTIWGRITAGLDVVKYVAAQGVAPGSPNMTDGPPAQQVVIKSATIGTS